MPKNRICRPAKMLLLALAVSTSVSQVALAQNDTRAVVRDYRGQVIHNSFGNCVRTQWSTGSDACGEQVAQLPVMQEQQKRRVRAEISKEARTVYFEFDKSSLTPEAQQRLNTLANTLKSDEEIRESRIVGFADRMGSADYNEKLSRKRAETVRQYLVNQGVINVRTAETRWLGESVPATQCPASLQREALIECLQKDRRVEVEIDYYAEHGRAR